MLTTMRMYFLVFISDKKFNNFDCPFLPFFKYFFVGISLRLLQKLQVSDWMKLLVVIKQITNER